MKIYLDNAATTKVRTDVISVMAKAMEDYYGNSSSVHSIGRAAEDALEKSRESLSAIIGGDKDGVIFNSGATEGNNQIIRAYAKPGAHLITSSIEHKSVLLAMKNAQKNGALVDYLGVDENGQISLDELKEKMTKNTALVSIMMVNNETGICTDSKAIGKVIRSISKKAKFHVDAVQSFLKYPIDVKDMDIDFLTVSAHKVHGPKGVGFLYVKKGLKPESLFLGGDHERRMRAGTVNVPGVVAFDYAAKKLNEDQDKNRGHVYELKKALIKGLDAFDGVHINSPLDGSSAYILNVSFDGIRGETFLHYLDEKGIYVATGSACNSKDTKDSHVLEAMHLDKQKLLGSIRFSFDAETTMEEITYTLKIIEEALQFLRRI